MKTCVLALMLICFMGLKSNAQKWPRMVRGVVTDGEHPISEVSVRIMPSTMGTKTDSSGRFEIEVNKGDLVSFSHLGMETEEIKINQKTTTLKIDLEERIEELEPIVVRRKVKSTQKQLQRDYANNKNIISTKFGYIDKDRSAYTIRMASGNELSKVSLNFLQALRMLFPQIRITTDGIYIRPNNSFRNTQGAIFDLDGLTLFSTPTISIDDIDRIAIVPSVSMAVKYGSAAAGGVIIINTKRGLKSNK